MIPPFFFLTLRYLGGEREGEGGLVLNGRMHSILLSLTRLQ